MRQFFYFYVFDVFSDKTITILFRSCKKLHRMAIQLFLFVGGDFGYIFTPKYFLKMFYIFFYFFEFLKVHF